MAHIRQTRPDSGLGFQVKVLDNFRVDPSSLGSGTGAAWHPGSQESAWQRIPESKSRAQLEAARGCFHLKNPFKKYFPPRTITTHTLHYHYYDQIVWQISSAETLEKKQIRLDLLSDGADAELPEAVVALSCAFQLCRRGRELGLCAIDFAAQLNHRFEELLLLEGWRHLPTRDIFLEPIQN